MVTLAVTPELRGRGLGDLLLRRAVEAARARVAASAPGREKDAPVTGEDHSDRDREGPPLTLSIVNKKLVDTI